MGKKINCAKCNIELLTGSKTDSNRGNYPQYCIKCSKDNGTEGNNNAETKEDGNSHDESKAVGNSNNKKKDAILLSTVNPDFWVGVNVQVQKSA